MSMRTRLTIAAATSALICISTTSAAQATTPSPQAPFTNSAGQTNGCVGNIAFQQVPNTNDGTTNMGFANTFTCPTSAHIHYGSDWASLYKVKPDKTWTLVQAFTHLGSWAEKQQVVDQGSAGWGMWPCEAAGQPMTYVARGWTQLRTTKNQADPFKVQLQATYTC